jgi:hypothetical protein
MDRTQLVAFVDYMIGERNVGGEVDGDPVGAPYSPELRAFILGRLGDNMPVGAYYIFPAPPPSNYKRREDWVKQADALAALLREVADGLAPVVVAEPAPPQFFPKMRCPSPHQCNETGRCPRDPVCL